MCEEKSACSSKLWNAKRERQTLRVFKTLETGEEDRDEEPGNFRSRSDRAGNNNELEQSGIFIAGYKGLIHKWDHPGYEFLTQSSKGRAKMEKAYKVIIVGDATVGKTSFVQRYVNDVYRGEYKGTVGVDFALKVMWKSETEMIKIQLWDIAGQERFTWMTRAYYRDAQGCIVMFDLANEASFKNAAKWKSDVDSKCQLPDGSSVPAILLGNKCDLPKRDVDQDEIEIAYNKYNFIGWTEVSAKQGLMVEDCMKFLVDAMISADSRKWSIADDLSSEANSIKLLKERKRRKCC